MARRKPSLWLRRTAAQVVAQWTARRVPSAWAETEAQRLGLIRQLCLELISAVADRIPDAEVSRELHAVHRRAWRVSGGLEPKASEQIVDAGFLDLEAARRAAMAEAGK